MYYSTTPVSQKNTGAYNRQASAQDRLVEATFLKHNRPMSPSEVHRLTFGVSTPITSTRRAISTLTRKGILTKTAEMTAGKYGRPEHLWSLNGDSQ